LPTNNEYTIKMNTPKIPTVKRKYTFPTVEIINLDSEISLALMSYPDDPGDMSSLRINGFKTPDYLSDKPIGV